MLLILDPRRYTRFRTARVPRGGVREKATAAAMPLLSIVLMVGILQQFIAEKVKITMDKKGDIIQVEKIEVEHPKYYRARVNIATY